MPPPERPSGLYEQVSSRWFRTFAPRLPRVDQGDPPAALHPFETVGIARSAGREPPGRDLVPRPHHPSPRGRRSRRRRDGTGTAARGAVLLLPPWLQWGRSYFHRRGRLEALRRAGYHALTIDFPGRGGSGPPSGFFDRDVEDALAGLALLAPDLPRHVWGVSAGGYWAHIALSRRHGTRGAMFEDVAAHLLEWADRVAPGSRLAHAAFRRLFPAADAFLDLRRHAPWLGVVRAAYVSGERDEGVPPGDTNELASLAGAAARIVPDAGHLDAIKRAPETVVSIALETFAAAEADKA